MLAQNLSGYAYVIAGFFLVLFFGGTLILQLLGVLAGLLMIRHGFGILATQRVFKSYFNSFSDIKFK